jgi:N-acyl-phosphatidylethanolamine-hydrolysing phospholipase D
LKLVVFKGDDVGREWKETFNTTPKSILQLHLYSYNDKMNDSLSQKALVQVLSPDEALTDSHHGPENYHYYRRNTAYEDGVPRYFNNPWPSYRSPSLTDAYRAYSLGAAIAHPEPRKLPGIHRTKSQISINEGRYTLKCEDGAEAPRLEKKGWMPEATYVRPVFAEVFEDDDEEEDWRDPPVKVVQPRWGGVGDKGEKETVTWLGHAGVLVQVPWRNNVRDGMCGVLYDPIFSYR